MNVEPPREPGTSPRFYVSPLQDCIPHKNVPFSFTCYLFTDPDRRNRDWLKKFIKQLGLPSWAYKVSRGCFPHAELTSRKRREAIEAGAIEASDEEAQQFMDAWRQLVVHGRSLSEQALGLELGSTRSQDAMDRVLLTLFPEPLEESPGFTSTIIDVATITKLATHFDRRTPVCGVAMAPDVEAYLRDVLPPVATPFLLHPSHVLAGIPYVVDSRMAHGTGQPFTDPAAWKDRLEEQQQWDALSSSTQPETESDPLED